jgi:hypothetical protein
MIFNGLNGFQNISIKNNYDTTKNKNPEGVRLILTYNFNDQFWPLIQFRASKIGNLSDFST